MKYGWDKNMNVLDIMFQLGRPIGNDIGYRDSLFLTIFSIDISTEAFVECEAEISL